MIIFAHRGRYGCTDINQDYLRRPEVKGPALPGYPPENSFEAMRLAFEGGYSVELDALMTEDRRVVITHTNDLSLHVKDAVSGRDYASTMTFSALSNLRMGMGGKTAPFMTYEQFMDLLARFPHVTANVEIKGTINARNLMPEPQNPSLIDRLAKLTPTALVPRVVFSSFAPSNILKIKKKIPKARIAQLFVERGENESKIYPDTDDHYLVFSPPNLKDIAERIPGLEAVHPCIDTLETEEGRQALSFCEEQGWGIRAWAYLEKNPAKDAESMNRIKWFIDFSNDHPHLRCDLITDYPDEVEKIIDKKMIRA